MAFNFYTTNEWMLWVIIDCSNTRPNYLLVVSKEKYKNLHNVADTPEHSSTDTIMIRTATLALKQTDRWIPTQRVIFSNLWVSVFIFLWRINSVISAFCSVMLAKRRRTTSREICVLRFDVIPSLLVNCQVEQSHGGVYCRRVGVESYPTQPNGGYLIVAPLSRRNDYLFLYFYY